MENLVTKQQKSGFTDRVKSIYNRKGMKAVLLSLVTVMFSFFFMVLLPRWMDSNSESRKKETKEQIFVVRQGLRDSLQDLRMSEIEINWKSGYAYLNERMDVHTSRLSNIEKEVAEQSGKLDNIVNLLTVICKNTKGLKDLELMLKTTDVSQIKSRLNQNNQQSDPKQQQ